MIEHVYQHQNGGLFDMPITLENMFNYNVRFQVIVDNEDQLNYLYALQLMYGRELEIDTWASLAEKREALMQTSRLKLRLLPIVFTTSKVSLRDFT
jgi:hypothetical protein